MTPAAMSGLYFLFLAVLLAGTPPGGAKLLPYYRLAGNTTPGRSLQRATYNQYTGRRELRRLHSADAVHKVETLGEVLKRQVASLRNTSNGQVELIFLVDDSGSVGVRNFQNELNFVKKLLADFTVDQDTTRVAVVAYSSENRIRCEIDHLSARARHEHHKCSLLEEELPKVMYKGGGTHTLGALIKAKEILTNARPTAQKVIFLITDGYSNSGDPRPLARELKARGAKIFTIGIHNGNERELREMASQPKDEHCYILDSFNEFEALARRALHEDLQRGNYILQRAEKCKRLCKSGDCCDLMAACRCGTHTGKYDCVCRAGFYGNGLKSQCRACPSGTYKNVTGPGDISTCVKCPDMNQHSPAGSTSVTQCSCKTGYVAAGALRCAAITCPKLEAPPNAYMVNNKCNNVVNAACGMKCRTGYNMRGTSIRMCQGNGTWSGVPVRCEVRKCKALGAPSNGNIKCTKNDFSFGTKCRFTCNAGFYRVGTDVRACVGFAFWSGIMARCREVTCKPLPEVPHGKIVPGHCTDRAMPYRARCSILCREGYKLNTDKNRVCGTDGRWTPREAYKPECIDVMRPEIRCPRNIVTDASTDEDYARVTWFLPSIKDNSGELPTLSVIPIMEPPVFLPVALTSITYIAEDRSGNKANCTFTVHVRDTQPPKVERCVSPGPFVMGSDGRLDVHWEEPVFWDNSRQSLSITSSHRQHQNFQVGQTEVVYTATDRHGNNNNCVITIVVKEHLCTNPKPPANGNISCAPSQDQLTCRLECHPGYGFAMEPAERYVCDYENGQWWPDDNIPDCSLSRMSNHVIQSSRIVLKTQRSCEDQFVLEKISDRIQNRIENKVTELCDPNALCSVENFKAQCLDRNTQVFQDYDDLSNVIRQDLSSNGVGRRYRRQVASEDEEGIYRVGVDFQIYGKMLDESSILPEFHFNKMEEPQNHLADSVENVMRELHSDVMTDEGGWGTEELRDLGLQTLNLTFEEPQFTCPPGSIIKAKDCVDCPSGTYYNIQKSECEGCSIGTYQREEGQLTCQVCPQNTSTAQNHSKSVGECKSQCLPGTFSPDGLEPCETCPLGQYQSEYASTQCEHCFANMTTLAPGSRQQDQCHVTCDEGYISKTGVMPCYPCPKGYLQPERGNVACFMCPNGTDTESKGATDVAQCIGAEETNMTSFLLSQPSELSVNDCFGDPCYNNATCQSHHVSYTCICKGGWTGLHCETEVDECQGEPCHNNATCVDRLDDFLCQCPLGYTGKTCSIDMDECHSSPCRNNATCIDDVNAFSCACAAGFNGTFCEEDMDDCAPSPCQNNATCWDLVASYRCECEAGFTGQTCGEDINECLSDPCHNGATCTDLVNSFSCTCLSGYTGALCESQVDECVSSPCQGNATCLDRLDGYVCECPPAYNGTHCEQKLESDFNLEFTVARVTDYSVILGRRGVNLTAFSVAFWMKTDDTSNYGTVLSYANHVSSNALTISDYSGFVLKVNGDEAFTDTTTNDGRWHHVAVTWRSEGGQWVIYKDGQLQQKGTGLAKGTTMEGGGVFVLGQDQDSVGGDFTSAESFIGIMSGLHMWDRPMSSNELQKIICSDIIGNVIAWPDFLLGLQGLVKVGPSTLCQECPQPKDIPNGNMTINASSIEGLMPQSIAVYKCHEGHRLVGPGMRTCTAYSDWDVPEPKCEVVRCPFPGRVNKAVLRTTKASFIYQGAVRYQCQGGYRIEGNATRVCMENGRWSGEQPSCVEVFCPIPSISGKLIQPRRGHRLKPGELQRYACQTGFRLEGDRAIICQKDGTWNSSVPSCVEVTCKDPPKIDHAITKGANRTEYKVNDTVVYECQEGYKRLGSEYVHCLATGGWSFRLPSCRIARCSKPSNLHNGYTTVSQSTAAGQYAYQTMVTFTCQKGYRLVGTGQMKCLATEKWSSALPSCSLVQCPSLTDIPFGIINSTETSYATVVGYLCDLGFELYGQNHRVCQENGTWTSSQPSCNPVTCPAPPDIEHGEVQGSNYSYSASLTYSCLEGYVLKSGSKRKCLEDKQWEKPSPECLPVECPTPSSMPNGNVIGDSFKLNELIEYSCNSGFRLVGEKVRICLSNGTWSDNRPICEKVTCPYPEEVENGLLDQDLEAYDVGSVVTYSCLTGYELKEVQGKGSRTCRGDGTWSGHLPFCKKISCGKPKHIDNGVLDTEGMTFGSRVQYECKEGYQLDGPAERTCASDRHWSGDQPSCAAILCSKPDPILYGNITKEEEDFMVGDSIVYGCEEGFYVEGEPVRECQRNQTWSGEEPSCTPVECPPFDAVLNGRVIGKNFTFMATVEFVCDEGYEIEGLAILICGSDGHWNQTVPVCKKIVCPSPDEVKNSEIAGDDLTYQATVAYKCNVGFELIGPASRKCEADGTWSGGVPKCIPIQCPQPPSIPHGKVQLKGLFNKDKVHYSCDDGYELVGDTLRQCGSNKQWLGEAPDCVKIKCGAPPGINQGRPKQEEAEYGDKVDYECEEGYVMDRPSDLSCSPSGSYTGDTPQCVKVQCVDPEKVANGNIILTGGNTYGEVIRYECRPGFSLVGETERKCQQDGQWSGTAAFCQIIHCLPEPENITNGLIQDAKNNTFGSKVTYQCNKGYKLHGSSTITCLEDGTWSASFPQCISVQCPKPEAPNMFVSSASGGDTVEMYVKNIKKFVSGMTIQLACETGHVLSGKAEVSCLGNATWSNILPKCDPITCAKPTIDNGVISGSNTYQGRIDIKCGKGYKLEGKASLHCQADGKWSGSVGTCVLVSCEAPVYYNGRITVVKSPNRGTGYPFGMTLKFICDTGYTRTGPDTAVCASEGTWAPEVPYCKHNYCSVPKAVKAQNRLKVISGKADKYKYGQEMKFRCDNGYELHGNETLTCGSNGEWQGVTPHCNLKLCDRPVIHNGYYYSPYTRNPDRLNVGSMITFDCNEGWSLLGNEESECLESKTWSSPAPKCKQVTCQPPELANLARKNTLPVVHGGNWTVECKEGHEVAGDEVLTCGMDGKWIEMMPLCNKVLCNEPDMQNGKIVKEAPFYYFGDVINVTCNIGHNIEGSETLTCSSHKTWTPSIPSCTIVKCPRPIVHHGRVKGVSAPDNFTYGKSVNFECQEGYTMTGSSEIRCQSDGTWSRLVKCNPVVCPVLVIPHAMLSSTAREFGAKLEITCETGFQLTGDRSVTCDASGKWKGVMPSCSMIQCPVPTLQFGKVIKGSGSSNFSFGDTIKFLCDDGHELNGESEVVCQEDRTWSSAVPYCSINSCGPFPGIPNSMPDDQVAAKKNFTYGQTVTVDCDTGYELEGDAFIRCGPSGMWLGQAWCKDVFCVPVDINYGSFIGFGSVNGSYVFGDMGAYECEDGYFLVGQADSMCMPDATWSEPVPSCERVMCLTPEIVNGYVTSDTQENHTIYANEKILYHCHEGYFVDGDIENTCKTDGNWDQVHPPCSKVSCPPLDVANAKIQDNLRLYGDMAVVLCEPGYELIGSSLLTCQADETWSDEPFCRQIKCPLPPNIESGEYMAEAFHFGSKVKYSCWEGYELRGESEHECLSNHTWSGEVPFCEIIECPVPDSPANGSLSFTSTTYKSVVQFVCDTGFNLEGAKEVYCGLEKEWSHTIPKCQLVTCEEPQAFERTLVEGKGRSFGDVIRFSCEDGYELEKDVEQICSGKGVWQGPVPMCVPVVCPAPLSPEHGYIITSGTTFNSKVRYLCDNGYELEGPHERICQSNGTWSEGVPECLEVTCPPPDSLSNGHIIGSDWKYKAVIEYICEKGFALVGDMIRSCRADKSWSGDVPRCKRKSCPRPKKVDNGFYKGDDFTFGAELKYGCNSLFELLGQMHRTCEADGRWSGNEPVCQILECPPPRLNDHTLMLGDDTSIGSSVTFQCDQGYQLVGDKTLVCMDSKTWDGHFPRCDKVSCGLPKIIENGQLDGNSYQYKDIVKFKCLQGYEINGNPEIHCQSNATWTPIQAECVPVSCGTPPEVSHGFINGDSFQFGDFVYYHCKDGFDLDGNNLLQCGSDGQWQGDRPRCHMVTCGHAPVIRHASTIVSRTTMGSKARYHCNRGYILRGSPMVECMKDGKWKFMDKPHCVPVNCGVPPELPHGEVEYPDTTLYNIARYHCNDGFKPSAKSNLVLQCGSEAKWNGSAPICERKSCTTPLRPDRGGFHGDNFTFDSTVIYWCDEGFVLQGPYNATCRANGTWDNDSPECQAVVCPALQVTNAHLNTSSMRFGVHVEVSCDVGYVVEGTNILQCTETGEWDVEPPKCVMKRQPCPPPSVPEFAVEPKRKFQTGDTWRIECQSGFESEGNATWRCLPNATWTQSPVTCVRKSCGPPNMDGRVLLMGRGHNLGDRLIYMCRAGFLPQRSTIITCGQDGHWHPPPSCHARCLRECQNGGTCIGLNKCKCAVGFTGMFCQKAQCVMPCFNGGICVGPYQCRCPPGYTGARCQKPVCDKPCAHGGICMRPNRCRCPRGYLPPFCLERPHRGRSFH